MGVGGGGAHLSTTMSVSSVATEMQKLRNIDPVRGGGGGGGE